MFKYWGNCVVHFLFILFFYVTLTVCGQLGKWKAGVCPKRRKEKPRVGSLAWGRWASSGMTLNFMLVSLLIFYLITFTILWLYMCTTVTIQMKMLLPLNTDAIHWTPAVFCLFVVCTTLLKLIFNYNFFFSFFQELTCGDQVCKQIYKRTMWLNSQNEVHCVFIVSLTDIITQQKLYLFLFIF